MNSKVLFLSMLVLVPLVVAGPVKNGMDRYDFTYRLTLPEKVEGGKLWVPLAKSDPYQQVSVSGVTGLEKGEQVMDRDHQNRLMVYGLTSGDAGKTVEIRYSVNRLEKGSYPVRESDLALYLKPERLVPLNETFKTMAGQVVEGKEGELERARALYDHVLHRMRYDKTGTGWGRGDAVYACDARAGNCTDFHAYFIALSRSLGMPARFGIGYTIPAETDEGEIAGYHCWAEIRADGKWVPVDISEASRFPELADYYFGHHPANRFEVTRGRDLVVDPLPSGGPINFLIYPLLEVEGKVVKTENSFRFKRR